MTEFAETEMRHYCRHKLCRSKLLNPTSNSREAFCTPGWHGSFYRHRCIDCEGPLARKREDQKVCRKSKCRSAWKARHGFGRYVASKNANLASETRIKRASKPHGLGHRPLVGPNEPPMNILGSYRWPGAAPVEPELLRKVIRAEIGLTASEQMRILSRAGVSVGFFAHPRSTGRWPPQSISRQDATIMISTQPHIGMRISRGSALQGRGG
jgi:hypothetical protein